MVFLLLIMALLWPGVVLAQQLPLGLPPDCPAQLAQSLTREEGIQQLANQRREGIVRYFQDVNAKTSEDLRKANEEILDLRKQVETLKNGAGSPGKKAD